MAKSIARLSEIRCTECRSLLARADIKSGIVEIKCVKCGTLNSLEKKIDIKPEGQHELIISSVTVAAISQS